MFQSHAKSLALISFIFCGVAANAQIGGNGTFTKGENNPYSKFGVGEMVNGNNTVLRGMGNVTAAYEHPYQVNTDNPSSYSFLQRTTFEAGATGSSNTLQTSASTIKTGAGRLSYLNIGIPLSKNAGMSFGFRPYSRSYYNLSDTVLNTSIGKVENQYRGEGYMNYAFIGGAIKHKGLSVGFNAGYMFGNYRNASLLLPLDTATTNVAFASTFNNYTRVGGIYWKGGIMYETKLDSEYTIRIGGTISLKQNLTERLQAYEISTINLGDTLINDTLSYAGEQKGKLAMPLSYSIGVMLARNDKWNLGIDFTGTQWSGFNSTPDNSFNTNVGDMSYRAAVGGEFVPDATNIRKYFARVTYRLGAYYGQDYIQIGGNKLPYYGLTGGLSLPFRRSLSRVHAGVDVGRLGMTTNNLIQQTYIRFTLGFSFNDKWFIPRKYD